MVALFSLSGVLQFIVFKITIDDTNPNPNPNPQEIHYNDLYP